VAVIDVTYSTNMVESQAERMRDAADVFIDDHAPGCTEPWIVELLCGLLKATGVAYPYVLETGGFKGTTSEWLARTIRRMGGGKLIVVEIDAVRADAIQARLFDNPALDSVEISVRNQDALTAIKGVPDGLLAFAFVDDHHTKDHVAQETELLLPKMRQGGLICYHDVYGSCDLQSVVRSFGGYCLDVPRAGPAGGLGILQV
jgi:predicted O-methyltransferase YrrM